MNINYENRHMINEIYIHDCYFEWYKYGYITKGYYIAISCISELFDKIINLRFNNPIFSSIQNFPFVGGGNTIYDMWLEESTEQYDKLMEISKKAKEEYTQLSVGTKYIQIGIKTNSGAEIFIICESVDYTEAIL